MYYRLDRWREASFNIYWGYMDTYHPLIADPRLYKRHWETSPALAIAECIHVFLHPPASERELVVKRGRAATLLFLLHVQALVFNH